MSTPQYNIRQADTGSRNYNQPSRPAPAPPKINPLKNWWNYIVNNARQTAFNPVNNWGTVVPNVPTNPLYSITNPFGVPAYGVPSMPTFKSNAVQQYSYTGGAGAGAGRAAMPPAGKFGVGQFPQILSYDSWLVASQNPGSSYRRESLAELLARGAVDPNASDPYEIGGSPYQTGVWVDNPKPPPPPPGGGWGGGGGGGGYTAMPSSPGYTGYGGGYNPSGAPRSAYYQGRGGGYGSGYGGYAGGQSQRSAWYGALLQWNI